MFDWIPGSGLKSAHRIDSLSSMLPAIDLAEVCGCTCLQFDALEGERFLEALTAAERVSRMFTAPIPARETKWYNLSVNLRQVEASHSHVGFGLELFEVGNRKRCRYRGVL